MNATLIRERPILFSGAMVRAILDKRKTQTRRVVAAPRWAKGAALECEFDSLSGVVGARPWPWANRNDGMGWWKVECPYGSAGDSLWVRETLVTGSNNLSYLAKGPGDRRQIIPRGKAADAIVDGKIVGTLIPSIHMPRWASRLSLEITEVRVERLQEITRADVDAEGLTPGWDWQGAYRTLWDSLNAKRGYSWESNPWVWVIAFTPGERQ